MSDDDLISDPPADGADVEHAPSFVVREGSRLWNLIEKGRELQATRSRFHNAIADLQYAFMKAGMDATAMASITFIEDSPQASRRTKNALLPAPVEVTFRWCREKGGWGFYVSHKGFANEHRTRDPLPTTPWQNAPKAIAVAAASHLNELIDVLTENIIEDTNLNQKGLDSLAMALRWIHMKEGSDENP